MSESGLLDTIINTIPTVSSTTVSLSSATCTLLSSSSSIGVLSLMLQKQLQYGKFLNTLYSEKQNGLYLTQHVPNFLPFNSIFNEEYIHSLHKIFASQNSLDEKYFNHTIFHKNGISQSFSENGFTQVASLLSTFCLLLVLYVLYISLFSSKKWMKTLLQTFWNCWLISLMNSLGELFMFSGVQLRYQSNNDYSYIDYIAAISSTFITATFLIIISMCLKKTNEDSLVLQIFYENWRKEFLLKKVYLLLFIIRDVLTVILP